MSTLWPGLVELLSNGFLIIGAVLIVIGAIGLLRLPDNQKSITQ